MTTQEVIDQLRGLGTDMMRKHHLKNGAQIETFGTKMADVRTIAKSIKSDHDLGLELWKSKNLEAMLLSTLILVPKRLSSEELEGMVQEATYSNLADWLNSNVVKQHPDKEALRVRWMASNDPGCARAGWSLTTERVSKNPEGLDLSGLLDRIEAEMATAPELSKWTMNYCLAEIGIKYPDHRARALAIGEKLGVYRDFPTSKGCTSPFAPIWIQAMVARQK